MAKILVIEDEADIQHILEFNLQQGGHKVTLAGRAEAQRGFVKDVLPMLARQEGAEHHEQGADHLEDLTHARPPRRRAMNRATETEPTKPLRATTIKIGNDPSSRVQAI